MTTVLVFTSAIVLAFGVGYIIGMVRMNRLIARLMTEPIENLTKPKK